MSLSTEDLSAIKGGTDPINKLSDKLTTEMGAKLQNLLFGTGEQGASTGQQAEGQPAGATPAAAPATPPVSAPSPAPAALLTPLPPDPSADLSIPEHERPPAAAAKATKEDWMRFRSLMNGKIEAERKEKEKFLQELETLRKQAPTKGIPSDEYERLKQEKAELEALVERTSLENSPRFKQHYTGQIEKEWKLIKTTAGSHADEVEKLLKSPQNPESRARWKELRDDLGIDGDLITSALGRIRALSLERDEQLSNHTQNMKLLRDKEAAEAFESSNRQVSQRKVATDALLDRARSLPAFKASPSDPDHLAFSSSALEFIRQASMGELSPTDAALLPVAAMQAQYLEKLKIPKLEAEITTLTERISQLTGAKPKVNGQTASAREVPSNKSSLTPETYDPMKAVQEITERFNKAMTGGA